MSCFPIWDIGFFFTYICNILVKAPISYYNQKVVVFYFCWHSTVFDFAYLFGVFTSLHCFYICVYSFSSFLWLLARIWSKAEIVVTTWGAERHRPQSGFSSRLQRPSGLHHIRRAGESVRFLLSGSGLPQGGQGVGLWEGMRMDFEETDMRVLFLWSRKEDKWMPIFGAFKVNMHLRLC